MPRATMYSTKVCPYCIAAKRFLFERKGLTDDDLDVIDLSFDAAGRQALTARTGQRTVPQIFIGDTHIGGYDDLRALDAAGGLDPLLAVP